LNYTKVYTDDWYGKLDVYNIMYLVDYNGGIYGCTFKNSNGDFEKKLIHEKYLIKS
jgi:hypothetical protein